jgi:hypothetical protein
VDGARSSSPPHWDLSGRTAKGLPESTGIDMTRHNPQGRAHTQGEPWHVPAGYHPANLGGGVYLEYLASEKIMGTARCFLGGAELMLGDTAPFINTQVAPSRLWACRCSVSLSDRNRGPSPRTGRRWTSLSAGIAIWRGTGLTRQVRNINIASSAGLPACRDDSR